MRKIVTKRIKILAAFIMATLIIVAIYAYQVQKTRSSILNEITSAKQQVTDLSAQIKFGDFSSQNVDDYIANLNKQITMLQTQAKISELITQNSQFFSQDELTKAGIDSSKTKSDLTRYELDREFMATAWLDYNLFRANPNLVDSYNYLARSFSELNYDLGNLPQATSEAKYVHQGEVIGLQGCSGVCTGTHVHFAMYIDDRAVDPCNYLPLRELSRWGLDSNCGVSSDKAQIAWPMAMTWIVTQNFSDVSPITHTIHGAVDIIDREDTPVLAAHNGWITTERKKCTGASICNTGAANVVTICQNQDCKKGIRTEYWHLDWFVE